MAVSLIKKYNYADFSLKNVYAKEVTDESSLKDNHTGRTLEVADAIIAKKNISVVRTYTEDEMRKLKEEAFEKGKEEGIDEQKNSKEGGDGALKLMSDLSEKFTDLSELVKNNKNTMMNDCIDLSHVIAKKLIGNIEQRFPKEMIQTFLDVNIPFFSKADVVNITVNDEDYELVKSYTQQIQKTKHLNFQITKSKEIQRYDCELSYDNTLIKQNRRKIELQLEKIINNYLNNIT